MEDRCIGYKRGAKMRRIMLHCDEKLYQRMKYYKYSWNEVLAIGVRAKQLYEACSGTQPAQEAQPAKEVPKDENEVM